MLSTWTHWATTSRSGELELGQQHSPAPARVPPALLLFPRCSPAAGNAAPIKSINPLPPPLLPPPQ